jgi:hypothetical protein
MRSPETVSQPTQVLIRNPGDELAGVAVSFAETGICVGAAPGLSLAGKLRALRAGCDYFSAETGHRVSSRNKKGPRGAGLFGISISISIVSTERK